MQVLIIRLFMHIKRSFSLALSGPSPDPLRHLFVHRSRQTEDPSSELKTREEASPHKVMVAGTLWLSFIPMPEAVEPPPSPHWTHNQSLAETQHPRPDMPPPACVICCTAHFLIFRLLKRLLTVLTLVNPHQNPEGFDYLPITAEGQKTQYMSPSKQGEKDPPQRALKVGTLQ
jgi:hypothetical protein